MNCRFETQQLPGARGKRLRARLDEGAKQAKQGEFVEFSVADTVTRAMKRARK